ncbi:unnamed protein product [Spirodela intermedia]|uniref:Uncharacterized protein n=1 Tax=Spirodela intermedia TaxID=51605 RepID=A0A7I8LEH5_SPIIN|nr:unnamed protein product [Spirodela intermedia]
MAVELMSERWAGWPPPSPSSPASSPRISFSGNGAETPSDGSLLHPSSSSPEFHFCVSGDRFDQDDSVADELFSDGFLLPLPPLPPRRPTSSSSPALRPAGAQPPSSPEARKGAAAALKQPSSFWKFSRSSSLNYGGAAGGGGRRPSMICSLPLLSRSKSAGPHPKPPTLKRRHQPVSNSSPATAAAVVAGGGGLSRKGSGGAAGGSRTPYYYGHHGGAAGGGVRIGPVLNLPAAYIPKGNGGGIFSLGRLLCSGRDRSKKKTPPPATP